MNRYRLACWLASVVRSCLKLDGIVRGLMDDNCVLDYLNHTTKLFNESWNCSNHALVVISTKYFLQWGHLWLEPPVSCHWATTAGQPPNLTIFCMYCTGGTECLSYTPGSHSAYAVRTPLGINRKIISIRKEPMRLWGGRPLEVQARDVLGSTPGGCWPFHFIFAS